MEQIKIKKGVLASNKVATLLTRRNTYKLRKVFLDDLPRGGYGVKQNCINWLESIGHTVKFVYDTIHGEILITNIDLDKQKIIFTYNNQEYSLGYQNFKNCKMSYILNLKTRDYKYKVGDIVKTTTGKIEILECIKLKYGKYPEKCYKYKCCIDGDIDVIRECHLTSGVGCSVCYNNKVLKGYNDIATTHPELVPYFTNIEDVYTHTYNSSKIIKAKCPICGFIKNIRISTLQTRGFGCNACSDGISYPEKFFINLSHQLKVNFITQLSKKTFKWCDKYRYDFYIPSINCIVETHGIQHYEENKGNWSHLIEIQANDNKKKVLAINNKINNYIIIDCRYSELDWIKNSIMNSELPKLLKVEEKDINWLKCHEFACNTLVKMVCDLWNSGIKDTGQISEKINLARSTVLDYLKKGKILSWCDFDIEQLKYNRYEKSKISRLKNLPSVICLNTLEIFENVLEANKKYKIIKGSIYSNCKNDLKSAGKHPITKEPLVWMYYEDYNKIKSNKELIRNKINKSLNKEINTKSVICLNTLEIFDSIIDASKKYNIHVSGIGSCCRGIYQSSGIEIKTNKPLRWMYYEDYINGKPIKEYSNNSKKVICLTTNEIFESIKDAEAKYKIKGVSQCCLGKQNSAGKDPLTKKPLIWMSYEKYLNISKEEINEIKKSKNNHYKRKIINLNTLEIFDSIRDASNKYNFNSSNINVCLHNNQRTCGKHPTTGEPLKWMYYDEYIKTNEKLLNKSDYIKINNTYEIAN